MFKDAIGKVKCRFCLNKGYLVAWISAFTAPLVVLFVALVFHDVVIKSIDAASHPSLVYGILLAFVLGILLCGQALVKYQVEEKKVRNWAALKSNEERRIWLEDNASNGEVIVYPALAAIALHLSSFNAKQNSNTKSGLLKLP